MPIQLIIQLLATFGPPAVSAIDAVISKWQANGPVSPEEWATLSAMLKLSAQDHMKNQLAAAGIALTDPAAVALLALSKGI